ncbi:unnamed protein product [Durusdinium trenchii]|uniref:Uncharacterized protein n=1 Tax=Durusdinium trenchii TaxID=1381693 RepID=A0ABP0PXE6_9DINO
MSRRPFSAVAERLRRLFLVTSPGLERSLERELQVLQIPGHFEPLPGGVAVSGYDETLWRCCLQSRLAELVLVRVGEPFHAPDLRSLDEGLRRLPWQDFLQASSKPIIKVSSEKSRLYHTKLLAEHVAASIPGTQANDAESPADELPEVRLRLRHNEAQVSVAASGLLHKRGARKAVGEASMRETLAAACVLASPLQRRLTQAAHQGEELVFWDPFCGSGAILLEALEVVLGQPTGNHSKSYPFKSFPCHDAEDFERVARELEPTPHGALGALTLLSSDQSEEQIQRARQNLRRCLRRLNVLRESREFSAKASVEELLEALPCRVQLLQGNFSKVLQRLQGESFKVMKMVKMMMTMTTMMIVTNVPFGLESGGKQDLEAGLPGASETYSQLGRVLRQQRAEWRGVYCLTAFPEAFRTHTGLEWSSELRFLNGRRWVDLLTWTGDARDSARPHESRGGGRRTRGRG